MPCEEASAAIVSQSQDRKITDSFFHKLFKYYDVTFFSFERYKNQHLDFSFSNHYTDIHYLSTPYEYICQGLRTVSLRRQIWFKS